MLLKKILRGIDSRKALNGEYWRPNSFGQESCPAAWGDTIGGVHVLYIIYQEDRDDGAETIRAANKDKHFAYLDKHQDILLLGGALLGDDGIKRAGSCLIINVPSREQAEEFSRNEPFRKAGLFKSVKITRMRRGQWNPAAAPKAAEGN